MTTAAVPVGRTTQEREAFADRIKQSILGAFDVASVFIGFRLGLYAAMGPGDASTSAQLAERTGTDERYVREWLEQQTLAGIVKAENPWAVHDRRRYCLPQGHYRVLADAECSDYLAPLVQAQIGALRPIDRVIEAFRTGQGVPCAEYGDDLRDGLGALHRAAFLNKLGTEWIPAMADVDVRLRAASPARIADVGCGCAWACIGMARAYPNAFVDGFDVDPAAVEAARRNVEEAGLSHRIKVHERDASDPSVEGQYHLVTALECIHEMPDPVGVLRTMRMLAGTSGAVLVIDKKVREAFSDEPNDTERMVYGWSVLHSLPVGRAAAPAVATGAVIRPGILRRCASLAGFATAEQLSIEHPALRFYRLRA